MCYFAKNVCNSRSSVHSVALRWSEPCYTVVHRSIVESLRMNKWAAAGGATMLLVERCYERQVPLHSLSVLRRYCRRSRPDSAHFEQPTGQSIPGEPIGNTWVPERPRHSQWQRTSTKLSEREKSTENYCFVLHFEFEVNRSHLHFLFYVKLQYNSNECNSYNVWVKGAEDGFYRKKKNAKSTVCACGGRRKTGSSSWWEHKRFARGKLQVHRHSTHTHIDRITKQ